MPAGDVQLFSPPLFNNYYGLEKLMKGEEALSEIETLSKDETFIKTPITDAPYFNRWHIFWISLKSPFNTVSSAVFGILSWTTALLQLHKISRIFSVLSLQMVRDWEQITSQWTEKSPMLMPAMYAHQISSWDIYGHGSIPSDFVEDNLTFPMTPKSAEFDNRTKLAMKRFYKALEKGRDHYWRSWIWRAGKVSKSEKKACREQFGEFYLKSQDEAIAFLKKKYPEKAAAKAIQGLYDFVNKADTYIEANFNTIPLFSDNGLCRGAALWFIYLCLNTKTKFEDPVKHLIAVAEQFKTGVPRQGALLHGLYDSDPLLKLKHTDLTQHRVSSYELDHDQTSALKKIETLPNGFHRLGTLDHALVYIKVSATEGYVWDPSRGLYPITPQKLLEWVLNHSYKKGAAESQIYFHHYEMGG